MTSEAFFHVTLLGLMFAAFSVTAVILLVAVSTRGEK